MKSANFAPIADWPCYLRYPIGILFLVTFLVPLALLCALWEAVCAAVGAFLDSDVWRALTAAVIGVIFGNGEDA